MAVRRELLLIILLILVIALLIKVMEFFKANVVEGDASRFVLEDLASKYPGADIGVMTITEKSNDAGGRYFEVKARVTEDADTPCPKRSHIFYNYPAQNFVAKTPEWITTDCTVCGDGICTIAFPEEAIIASHTLAGTDDVADYLRANTGAVPSVTEKFESDSWLVEWGSPGAASSYAVTVHRNGSVLSVNAAEAG